MLGRGVSLFPSFLSASVTLPLKTPRIKPRSFWLLFIYNRVTFCGLCSPGTSSSRSSTCGQSCRLVQRLLVRAIMPGSPSLLSTSFWLLWGGGSILNMSACSSPFLCKVFPFHPVSRRKGEVTPEAFPWGRASNVQGVGVLPDAVRSCLRPAPVRQPQWEQDWAGLCELEGRMYEVI